MENSVRIGDYQLSFIKDDEIKKKEFDNINEICIGNFLFEKLNKNQKTKPTNLGVNKSGALHILFSDFDENTMNEKIVLDVQNANLNTGNKFKR